MTRIPIDPGPLEVLLTDPAVTAIYLDSETVRYEKAGTTHTSGVRFESDGQRRQVIESIVAACGVVLTADHPAVDGVLSDGTRVCATFAPLSMVLHKRD